MEIIDDTKDINEIEDKALFIQRLFAFLIDVTLVMFAVSVISLPFVDTKDVNELNNRAIEIEEDYFDGNISSNEFSLEYADILYKSAKSRGEVSFFTIVLYILYFVVFQIYNKGQTIGKKFMKIKVVSQDGDLTMNQMIFRSFIANSILLNIISFIFVIFFGKMEYFSGVICFSLIQYLITIISIFMVIYSKKGMAVHDKLFHTRVVRCNKEVL